MSEDLLIGRQLDEYRLEKLLGRGGMARVYRGIDVQLKRHVAIKVIDAPFRADSDYARRFQLEAQAIAQLEHPNIVAIYRYGEVDGLLYMAMQYIEGSDLHAVLASYRNDHEFIAPQDLLRVLRDVAGALDYAHSQGVVHRDIKPSNIMLNKREQAIVADFGLALLTEVGTQGEILGSPHYIAPEQAISSRNAVPQSDLYALGVIIYEALTGHLPFDAPEPLDVAMMHITEPPPPLRRERPELSAALEAVVLKAMAKEPRDRYPTCTALLNALEKALMVTAATAPVRLSVAERVEIGAAANPLPILESKPANLPPAPPTPKTLPLPPPLAAIQPAPQPVAPAPAVVAPQPPPPPPPAATQPKPPPSVAPLPLNPRWIAGGCGLLVLLLLCGACAMTLGSLLNPKNNFVYVPLLFSGADGVSSGITDVAPTIVPTAVPSTFSTDIPTPVATTLVTLSPTPAQTTNSYQITLVSNKNDGIFVYNSGTTAIPLAALTLTNGTVTVEGKNWNWESLAVKACVALWKDGKTPKFPNNFQCTLVGATQTGIAIKEFWVPQLLINYNGTQIGQCSKNVVCNATFP